MRALLIGFMVLVIRVDAQEGMGCVKEVMVPSYDSLARRSPGGSVRAIVTIGESGRAESVETVTADANLGEQVRGYLIRQGRYDEACKGKKVEFVFTFQLEGTPEHTPPVWVKFQPPNRFVVISRPQKLILDTIR